MGGKTRRSLQRMSLESGATAPLYQQIYQLLRGRIRAGIYNAGETIPPESELTRLFGVSRITAKRALNELAAHGLVRRHRGRGTIVTYDATFPVVKADFSNLRQHLIVMGLKTEVEVLELTSIRADAQIAKSLQVSRRTRVQRAVRLRRLEGEPFAYIVTHVPAELADTYDRDDLSTEPMVQLLERAGVKVCEAEQTITAMAADAPMARALQIAVGAPLLAIRRVMRDRRRQPVQLFQGHYRPDRFEYLMQLKRRTGGTWEDR
jgi:GntR family transcriptional regulator